VSGKAGRNELGRRLAALARTPVLLVATDYDGTLAPIVSDPAQARPLRESVVALRQLASLANTHVAVISGRALHDLAGMVGEPEDVHLVGSHGSEFDPDFAHSLPSEARALHRRVQEELAGIAARMPGLRLEPKPASVALHYREAPEELAEEALHAVQQGPGALEGVFTRHGKKVVELAVLPTHKGSALAQLRQRVGATAVCFLGDDVTDEDAFAVLSGPDLAVKVGDGPSLASLRVADPEAVARILAELAERRAAWLAGAEAVPIEHHACLSDQRTFALVTPAGRITWLCLPRLDSPALFAELLGGPAAGHFSVSAADGSPPLGQRWLGDCFVLETRWRSFRVVDFLDASGGRPQLRAGRTDLVRRIEGRGRVRIELAPRLDFGRIPTRLRALEGGIAVEPSHDPIVVRAPGVCWTLRDEGPHQTAHAELDLGAGPVELELRYGTGSLRPSQPTAHERERQTILFWSSWAGSLTSLPGGDGARIRRSALVLKALCHGPTGAIAAAATTSLPEFPGGVRNWDYRYCWLRDAALAAASLVRLGSTAEALHYLGWVLRVVDRIAAPERLQPLYCVAGEPLGSEGEISELPGYRGSRPVRVGNLAAHQLQLDVFGPVVELVALLAERDAPLSSEHWRLVEGLVGAVAARWEEPDHGIWEIRRAPRHHVHSKVMCWIAAERGVRIAELFGRERRDWRELADRIAADVLRQGWKDEPGAFVAAYDGHDLDAAALSIGLSGLLPVTDPRWRATVEAVEAGLRHGPTVYRYRADDGLPGGEGGFHLCAAWLVQALLTLGRREDARALFEAMAECAGPTGMLSEEYDPVDGVSLGNTPQAYSHLAVIEAALALAAAEGAGPPQRFAQLGRLATPWKPRSRPGGSG
jgi:trehalose-phosphatase